MIGDSITDGGRTHPVGEAEGLGSSYVSLVQASLGAEYPERRIRVLNTGISGNRVTDLEQRWERDVEQLKPDWLSVMIGINDVWRQFDRPFFEQVHPELFEETLGRLVSKQRDHLVGLVLMTPFFLEPNLADPIRKRMDEYGAIVKKIALEHSAIFVDVQAAFDRYLAHASTMTLCADRVHPNQTGHMIICRAFMEAISSSSQGAV